MAEKEDIIEKIKRTDPAAYRAITLLNDCLREVGCPSGVTVTTTEDMTDEEKEMALFEGFLREGYDQATAERKAKEWLSIMNKFSLSTRRKRKI
jgi:hypothetical protein